MQDRRSFLVSGLISGLVSGLISGPMFAAPLPLARSSRHLPGQRHGNFFIVNGWVLTADDVRALATRAL